VGRRPFVVLSRDSVISARRRVVVAPCSTHVRGIPTEVELEPGEDPIPRPCAVNLDSIQEVAVSDLSDYLGRLGPSRMRQVCEALRVAVDCR
jgi:mRNA interferase MazF